MLDPEQLQKIGMNTNNELQIDVVPEFDYMLYDFEDEKELKKYFKAVERCVRQSFEYKEFIQYIKNNFGMDQCAFIKSDKGIEYKVEQHHYPFTLYDIVEIVYKKRVFYGELLDVELTAKEVTMLHYKMIVGLIPLSKTAHQLHHDGKLFIPVDKVFGRYKLFVDLYKQFMSDEQLDILDRIEHYTENPDLACTSVLDRNLITISSTNPALQMPDFNQLQLSMIDRIQDIKNNNYLLPTIEELQQNNAMKDSKEDRRAIVKEELPKSNIITPIHFEEKPTIIEPIRFVDKPS